MYCTTGFVIGICKSIIIDFMTISQKIIYTLLSSFMHRSLKVVVSDSNLPPFLLLLNILEHMCFTTFYNEYNPSPNSVKLMVDKFLTFHEKIQRCSLLVTFMTSLWLIMSPPSTSRLSLLKYLSEINLTWWRHRRRTEHKSPKPHLFFC